MHIRKNLNNGHVVMHKARVKTEGLGEANVSGETVSGRVPIPSILKC